MASCKVCNKQVGCACNLTRGMCKECAGKNPRKKQRVSQKR